MLHPDRLLPSDPEQRAIARRLYDGVRDLPIVSPHGHTDPRWFAENKPFENPAQLFVAPDHYIYRMLYSQGVKLEDLGVRRLDGGPIESDPRKIWRRFAERYHLFRGTPTRLWLDHAFETLFGLTERLSGANADAHYDAIDAALKTPAFAPRALFERFNIEAIATTDSPLDELKWHRMIRDSGWKGRVVTAYRPDPAVDPDFVGFRDNVRRLGELTGEDAESWRGYLDGAPQAPRILQEFRRDLDRPRPSERAHRRPRRRRSGGPVPPRAPTRRLGRGQGAVPRSDADGDGGDELRRRARHADPSRLAAQPQPDAVRRLWPRYRPRHSDPHRLCARVEAAHRPVRQSRRSRRSSCSRSTRRPIRASLRRSPAIIPRCGSDRPGGSSTRRTACAASAS